MKNQKMLLNSFLHLAGAIAVGVLLLTLVYCIPTERIQKNVKESALNTIQAEGLYPEITHYATSYLDNWTDSIMLAEAAYPNGNSPLADALQVPRYVADEFPNESLVKWADTGDYTYRTTYPQYWHGYLIWLKPLLLMMDYDRIRILNGILQTLISLTVVWSLWKKKKREYILPWLISLLMLMPVAMAKSMQFSSCYYIFAIAGVVILNINEERRCWPVLLYSGIATAFFDFLTYPISTFGIPAVFLFILYPERNLREAIKRLFFYFVIWSLGYGLMWGGKLLAGSLITGADFLGEAEGHVTQWFDGDRWFSVGYVFYFNVRDFVYTPASFLAIVFVATEVFRIIKEKACNRETIKECIPYILIAMLPFAWYLFLFNPSGIHHFFTNKACVVSAFGGMCMLVSMLQGSKKRNEENA